MNNDYHAFPSHRSSSYIICRDDKAILPRDICRYHYRSGIQQYTLFCLQCLLSSIPNSTRPLLPITSDIMAFIWKVLTKQPSAYQPTMLWAACCAAFFGFLQVSEFTVPSGQNYYPLYHLLLSGIALDHQHAPTTVRLHINQSKMDPLRKGANQLVTFNQFSDT